jgi:hypothetical protein
MNSKPPITGTTHLLSYNQLSPLDFERLCLWLVNREGYENAEHLGASGGEQGRDIVAWQNGERKIFQCKRVDKFSTKDACEAVDKILKLPIEEQPVELIFYITCNVSEKTRSYARSLIGNRFKCTFYASTEFDEKVKRFPEIVKEFFQIDQKEETPDEHKRSILLMRVQEDFINGELKRNKEYYAHFTNSTNLIPIRKQWANKKLANPPEGNTDVLPSGVKPASDGEIPQETNLLDIFKQAGSLLILGAPGSGKTLLMLELTRLLAVEAQGNPQSPVPVVLHLSTWTNFRKPLAEWIEDELNLTRYGVSREDCQSWIEKDQLAFMLDDLDKIPEGLRDDCIRAISHFVKQHGSTSLAVFCRTEEYKVITDKLDLRRAMELEPLSPEQVQAYFTAAGDKLRNLHESSTKDSSLLQELQNPLMLYTISVISENKTTQNTIVGEPENSGEWKKNIFGAYVDTRLAQIKNKPQPFKHNQTVHWLSWLARCLDKHHMTYYTLDQMQPSWLPSPIWIWMYIFLSRLAAGLTAGLLGSILVGLGLRHFYPVQKAFRIGLIEGLLGGLVAGITLSLIDMLWIIQSEKAGMINKPISFKNSLIRFLVVILCVFSAISLTFASFGWILAGLQLGILFSLCTALLFAFGARAKHNSSYNDIQNIELLSWSGKLAWRGGIVGLIAGLLGGGIVGIFFGCSNPLVLPICEKTGITSLSILFGTLLITGIFATLIGFLFGGLGGTFIDKIDSSPYIGIRLSIRNALRIGGGVGIIFYGAGALAAWLVSKSLDYSMTYGLYGLFIGVLAGLYYGGLFAIQHFTLCIMLWLSGCTPNPFHLVKFLEFAAQNILLSRAGSAYKFFQTDLQDYFLKIG